MNPLWIMGLLLVGSVLWLVLPLCWKPDRPLPAGIEDEASERHQLQAEKRRLLAELKRLQAEQIEGRLQGESLQRLLRDSEAALAAVLQRLDKLQPSPGAVSSPRPHSPHWLAALLLAASVAAGASALFRQQWRDPPSAASAAMPGDIAEMVARLEQRLQSQPDSFPAWMMAGRTYRALGESDKARAAWQRAYQLKPESTEARYQHALGLLELDQPDHFAAALQHFDALIQLQPDSVELAWYRGLALFSLNRFADARQQWQPLLPRLPAEGEEHDMVQDALRRADAARAGHPSAGQQP